MDSMSENFTCFYEVQGLIKFAIDKSYQHFHFQFFARTLYVGEFRMSTYTYFKNVEPVCYKKQQKVLDQLLFAE